MAKKSSSVLENRVIQNFLDQISPLRRYIKDMYLFGSRSRDDWRPDSDYDILIVLASKERAVIDKFYDAIMEVLLSTGKLISLKIFDLPEFNRLKSIPTPFMQKILDEGIRIGS